jgi:hypothetical protein
MSSGVVCETDPTKIKAFFRRKSLNLGWIEDSLGVESEDLEATAGNIKINERGQDAYYLQRRYQEVKDYIANLQETKILNFKF